MSAHLRRDRHEDGFALVSAVIVLLLTSLIGLAILQTVNAQTHLTGHEVAGEAAFNLAESAVDAEALQLEQTWPGSSVTAYPRGLTREQMSVQARVMGIADIFEALTAKDRPYKPGKTLSESLGILGRMKQGGHIDPDLFDIFVREKVYLQYAREFLDPEQIDDVDETKVPGYKP